MVVAAEKTQEADNTEQLLSSMQKEADAEKEKIETEAAERVASIRREGEQELEQIQADATRRLERELAMTEDRLVGQARMDGRSERVRIKQELLDNVYQAARTELSSLSKSTDYAEVIGRLIGQLAEEMNGEVVLEVARDERKLAEEALKRAGLSWTLEAGHSVAGTLIARSADGRKIVDNSVSVRLERAGNVLSGEIASILFGGDRPQS